MKYSYLTTFIIAFLITSCGVPKYIKKNFTVKYTPNKKVTNIKTNGFYFGTRIYKQTDIDSMCYIFLPNRIYLKIYTGKKEEILKNINILNNADQHTINKSFFITHSFYKGTYKINDGTIIAQSISAPSSPPVWLGFEEQFLIINDTTIQIISKEILDSRKWDKESWENEKKNLSYGKSHFIQAPVPDSIVIWLMDKKWFWENEEEYKQWKMNKRKK